MKVLRRAAVAFAALVVAAFLAEGVTRLVDHFYCLDIRAIYFAGPNRDYGWAHEPGATGWMKRCAPGNKIEWETFTRINSKGLRDREFSYERNDAYRILILGDSFAQALQVDQDKTFAKELERDLNAVPGARRVEVINTGNAGYGTDNELLFYRHEARRYHPDLVLLVFTTENDVYENSHDILLRIQYPYPPKPYFELRDGHLVEIPMPGDPPTRWRSVVGSFQRMLYRHSLLYRLVLTRGVPNFLRPAWAEQPDIVRQAGQLGSLLRDTPPEWREGWRLTRALVRRLAWEVRRDGAKFAVVVIVGAHEVSERRLTWRAAGQGIPLESLDKDKAERTIVDALRAARIPTISLLPAFRQHLLETKRDEYFDYDIHWRPEGHRLAGEVIAKELRAMGLVPAAPPEGATTPALPP
jgi:hypothetical protein